jgi:hypothetical protein
MKRAIALGLLCALAAATGCGGRRIVPVSGIVKVNGEPYANAIVTFQPMGDGKADDVGARGSSGVTDENGKFTLIYDGDKPGAVVGKHRVRIFSKVGTGIPDTEGDREAADKVAKDVEKAAKAAKRRGKPIILEPIPEEWHEKSGKTFEVPRGGTSEANFDIDSPLMRKAGQKKKWK